MAEVTDFLACLVKQLCGERTGTYAGAVGFHDAIDVTNLVGTDAQTRAGTCTDSIRRGDKGIAAEIDVKHGSLGTFAQHALATLENVIDFMLRIDDGELAQVLNALQPLLLHLGDVVLEVE